MTQQGNALLIAAAFHSLVNVRQYPPSGRFANCRRRAREARRRGGLFDAVEIDKNLPRRHVRMPALPPSTAPARSRRRCRPRSRSIRRGSCLETSASSCLSAGQARGPCSVEAVIRETGVSQQRVELRLDRADRHELAAGAFIDVVEMRAAIEKITLAPLGPAAHRGHVEEHRHQRGRAIAHRGVDHLTLAGGLRFQQRRTRRTPDTTRRRRNRRPD